MFCMLFSNKQCKFKTEIKLNCSVKTKREQYFTVNFFKKQQQNIITKLRKMQADVELALLKDL